MNMMATSLRAADPGSTADRKYGGLGKGLATPQSLSRAGQHALCPILRSRWVSSAGQHALGLGTLTLNPCVEALIRGMC